MPAHHTYGSTLQIGDQATSEAFTNIALVMAITPPPLSRSSVDVTHLQSGSYVSEGHRERLAGIADSGPLSFTIFYDPVDDTHDQATTAEPKGLLNLWRLGVVRNFQVVFADAGASVWGPFPAFVSNFAVSELGVDAAGQATVELTLTGEPTQIP